MIQFPILSNREEPGQDTTTVWMTFELTMINSIVNIDLYVVNIWQVGYLKALDIWVASCFVFLAVAVSEVLIMFVLGKRARDDATQDQFELMVRTLY